MFQFITCFTTLCGEVQPTPRAVLHMSRGGEDSRSKMDIDIPLLSIVFIASVLLFLFAVMSDNNYLKEQEQLRRVRLWDKITMATPPSIVCVPDMGRVWVFRNRPLQCALCGHSIRHTQKPWHRGRNVYTHQGCIAPNFVDPSRGGRGSNVL